MDAIRAFFTKSGHFFFDFQNRAGEASPRPPPSCAPALEWLMEGQVAQLLATGYKAMEINSSFLIPHNPADLSSRGCNVEIFPRELRDGPNTWIRLPSLKKIVPIREFEKEAQMIADDVSMAIEEAEDFDEVWNRYDSIIWCHGFLDSLLIVEIKKICQAFWKQMKPKTSNCLYKRCPEKIKKNWQF